MSLELILMRHAKSDWDDPLQDDHERPLNPRGRRNAAAIGRWLADRAMIPDVAMVSDATRTRETWALISADWPDRPHAYIEAGLYLAAPDKMLLRLKQARGARVMLLAHNPGSAMLAQALCNRMPDHTRFLDFPTASTLVLRFDAPQWSDIRLAQGQVINFVTPDDLG